MLNEIECPHCGKMIQPEEFNTFDNMCSGCRFLKVQTYAEYLDIYSGKMKTGKIFVYRHKVEGLSVCDAKVSYCVLDDMKNENIEIHSVSCRQFLDHYPNEDEKWHKMKNYDDAREKAGSLASMKDNGKTWAHPTCCKNNN